MELARADHRVNGRSLTSHHTSFAAVKDDSSYSGPLPASPVATLPAFPIGLGRSNDSSDGSIAVTLSSRAPRETGSTVENIYKQYLPSGSLATGLLGLEVVSTLDAFLLSLAEEGDSDGRYCL